MYFFTRNYALLWCAIAFSITHCSLKKKTCTVTTLSHNKTKEYAALMQRKSDLSKPYAESQNEVARLKYFLDTVEQKMEILKKSGPSLEIEAQLIDLDAQKVTLQQRLIERSAILKKIKEELMLIANQL